jgi:hypothetical protein
MAAERADFDWLIHRVSLACTAWNGPALPLRVRQRRSCRISAPQSPPSRLAPARGACRLASPLLMRAARRQGMLGAMGNPYGITLDDASLRWAAAEGVSEAVIAAICLLDQKSVDEIVAKLTTAELEQVIKIVGRSPRGYPPGAYDALKGKRNLASPQPSTERLSRNGALESGQPAASTNPGTEHSRRIHARRFTAPEVPQSSTERATARSAMRRVMLAVPWSRRSRSEFNTRAAGRLRQRYLREWAVGSSVGSRAVVVGWSASTILVG